MTKRICILGGSGFVGTWLASELVVRHNQVLLPTRYMLPNHPLHSMQGVGVMRADIHNPDILRKLFAKCDAVVNLVGILNEQGTDGSGFHHVHVELASKIVLACEDTGVKRLLQMSALKADAMSSPSYYLRSKGQAEDIVMDAQQQRGLEPTSFRPSVIFGRGDSFFNRFASLLRFAPVFPLACPDTVFAPVYVGDVVESFIAALDNDDTIGERYDLCGPNVYSLRELVEFTASTCGMKRYILGLGDTASRLQAKILGKVPGKPMTYDNYLSLTVDSFCDKHNPTLVKRLHSIEEIVPDYLCT